MFKTVVLVVAMCWGHFAFAGVEVNTATAAELDSVQGIGPSLSTAILKARRNGVFLDWEDLRARVKGLGSRNAARLSAKGLTVDGTAFVAPGETR
jgi:competence protein ComEA